ncbi:MAG TPA: hypothetical protein VET24_11770 [Actinomycetota bacterium]|nr:hypothetical protein [Actinomycetota bacterium]
MPEIIRAQERTSFKRCRRAWDLGSRSRQNYEPLVPGKAFDLERAIHDALALWYFPGMWEWDRSLVRRFAMEGFDKSMRKQLDVYAAVADVSETLDEEWHARRAAGEQLLERYFAWAPAVDTFSPVRVDTDFDANVPDPTAMGVDLVATGGGPIHYHGRVDALVVDAYDAYWIMDHRVVEGGWENLNQLLLDEQGVAACWAWEIFYYGMKIAGTIYNELRLDAPEDTGDGAGESLPVPGQQAEAPAYDVTGRRRMYMEAARIPDQRVEVGGNEAFRRTRITRTRAELAACGRQIAEEALEMTSPGLVVYPSPSVANCAPCAYRDPCIALNMGTDVQAILRERYRDRGPEEVEEGRLGGVTWSMNRGARPPKLGS